MDPPRAGLAFCTLLALSGCLVDLEEARLADATLRYDGAEAGSHEARRDCQEAVRVVLKASIEAGELRLVVSDGTGRDVYTNSVGNGSVSGTKDLRGDAGPWTLTALRTDGFAGSYRIALDC